MIDGIPDQRKCDADDPAEFAAWAMVNLPLGPTGQSVAFHPSACSKASEHLWSAGFRHHPELQTTWYHMPPGGSVFEQMNGSWEDKPPARLTEDDPMITVARGMTPAQRSALRRALDTADEKED